MSRIGQTFAALKAQNKKALIPFITAGDPGRGLTVPLMHALVEAGADIIELGVPFSDPMADGPTIQRASERALKHGVSLRDVIGMVMEHFLALIERHGLKLLACLFGGNPFSAGTLHILNQFF